MKILDTNKISSMIKESVNKTYEATNKHLIKTHKVGATTYGIVKENGTYVVKSTNKEGSLLTEDFTYIGGEQNRGRFMRYNLNEAKRFFHYYLAEQSKKVNEDDKYVIKKDVEPAPVDDAPDMEVDDQNVDAEMEDATDEADPIETDLEEYQELTGKLSYILREVEEDKKEDTVKYIFNSLIAALPEVSEDLSSSIMSKFEEKLKSSEEETEDEEELTESLKKEGYIVSESMSVKEALAFLGKDDESKIFVQKPTRFYDGETKEPHMNKNVHPVGDSTPYDEKGTLNEDEVVKRKRPRIGVKRASLGSKRRKYQELQANGDHNTLAIAALEDALVYHGGGYVLTKARQENRSMTSHILFLKSFSKKNNNVGKLMMQASKSAKKIINQLGYKVVNENEDDDDMWETVTRPIDHHSNEDYWKDWREEEEAFEKLENRNYEQNLSDYEKQFGNKIDDPKMPSVKSNKPQDVSIEDMLKDEYLGF